MVDDDGQRRTPDHGHPISSPCEPNGSGELKMVDDDGQTTDHGHPISSPCEPNGSGELKIRGTCIACSFNGETTRYLRYPRI